MNIGLENESIEFKKSTSELKEGVESISSILNKHGHGTLYFGVKDDGEIVGQKIGKETARDVSSAIRNNINPNCEFEIEPKMAENGKQFIVVSFYGNRAPYSAYGKFFIRHSDQDHLMTPQEIEEYYKKKLSDYSEWEKKESEITIDDIDEKLLKNKYEVGFETKRIPFAYSDKETAIAKLGLLSRKGKHLNKAGEMLFSSQKPVLLKLATFATETKDTFLKLEHFQGNIYECIDKSISYLLEEISWHISFDGSAQRKESPEIPVSSIREVVVNAFGHGRYESNTTFEISVFKDRITIYSPGLFPYGFSPEDFGINHEEPIMLNPKIVSVLFKTNEIESFGYGFETIFKDCFKENIKFQYENTKSGFRFIFYRPLSQKYFDSKLTETDISVLNFIKEDGYIRIKDLAKKINVSEKTIYRSIKKLKEKKYISRKGDDYTGYWEVK